MAFKLSLAITSLVLGACSSHVRVAPLPPQMTSAQRVQAYQTLRPALAGEEEITRCGQDGCATEIKPFVRLADGTKVREPDDLLVLVPGDSVTAREARRYAALRSRRNWTYGVATVGLATGFLIAGAGLTADDHVWDGEGLPGDHTMIAVGATIALGSMITGLILGYRWHGQADRHKRKAFTSYDADLAQRLQLCTLGLQIVPCEGTAPPGATEPGTL